MQLIGTLAAGVVGAENGYARIFVRGSSKRARYYEDFEGRQAIDASDVQLDGNGGAVVYTDVTVDVFVYGENDPWGAEPFHLGKGARDSYIFTAPGANHGANVAGLVADEKALATARILKWAGVASATVQDDPSKAKPLAKYDRKLDKHSAERQLRP